MLFNSFLFIFCFFPIFYVCYLLLTKLKDEIKEKIFLINIIIFSLFFYSYWNLNYLPIICISIIINFYFSKIIIKKKNKYFIIFPVLFNLSLLFYYKYFSVLNGYMTGENINFHNIIIPLGISFFTFQQIGYLIELKNEKKNI